jgi:hypothetical protein
MLKSSTTELIYQKTGRRSRRKPHRPAEKAIKEMRDKKVTGDDDVPVEALKLLGDDGLNLLT